MNTPVKPISSRDNPLLQRIRKLSADPGAYRKLDEVWLEGDHLGSALLARGGRPSHAVVSESGWARGALRALAEQAEQVVLVPDALMATLSTLESPVPIGFLMPWSGPGELQVDAPSLVLDRLQDAGNVGTLMRSAAAFGFKQVLAIKGTAALWSPKVMRAGMGAHFGLRLVEGLALADLDALQVPLVGTSLATNQLLPQAQLPSPCAWVMGHEGQGVAPELLARCALTLRIPQPGGEESLNVAAAAAVCLYESARQR
jgi:TrmH family RNA methyltransferase